jgi:hypothetical protein
MCATSGGGSPPVASLELKIAEMAGGSNASFVVSLLEPT